MFQFGAVAKDIDTRGPLPVFLFVLSAGFVGGIGLEQTVVALQPAVSVTAEVTSCGYSGRNKTCSGRYTVDGVEHSGAEMPVESVPSDRRSRSSCSPPTTRSSCRSPGWTCSSFVVAESS